MAAYGIQNRRYRANDPDLSRFPDPGDLFGLIAYVHAHQRVPLSVLAEDAKAQLVIIGFLRAELERRTRMAIRLARRAGVEWRDLAGPLGVRTAQGAQQTLARLDALLEYGGSRNEKVAIAHRRAAAAEAKAVAKLASPVRAFIRLLEKYRHELPDGMADDLDELQAMLPNDGATVTPAVAAYVRGVCREIRQLPSPPRKVREAVDHLFPQLTALQHS